MRRRLYGPLPASEVCSLVNFSAGATPLVAEVSQGGDAHRAVVGDVVVSLPRLDRAHFGAPAAEFLDLHARSGALGSARGDFQSSDHVPAFAMFSPGPRGSRPIPSSVIERPKFEGQ
eukprot:3007986-Pyramimonas_sp.AAC.1